MDAPLTELQEEFRRDRVFRDDGQEYKVIGLSRSWDTMRHDYAAYYHKNDCHIPPTRVNDPSKRVEHSFFVSIPYIRRDRQMGNVDKLAILRFF